MPATEVHVWRVGLDSAGWPSADSLPDQERVRAARLLNPTARRRWAASRWALRGVLGRYLEVDPAKVELRGAGREKPILGGPSKSLRFNLSHSRDLALVAITQGRSVGVDIEWIDPRREVLALALRALDPAAARSVEEALPAARVALFHAAWARREAIAKCAGAGLWAPPPSSAVAVATLNVEDGFAAAIAAGGERVPPLRRFAIEPELTLPAAG
jgi:4'-phosphopantetheinyl transferase